MARTRLVPARELNAKKGLRAKDYIPKPKKPRKKPAPPSLGFPKKLGIPEGTYDRMKNHDPLHRLVRDGVMHGSLLDYTVLCHEAAKSKGWWEGDNANVFAKLLMMVTEIAEMTEEARKTGADLQLVYLKKDEHGQLKPEGFPIEMADLFIRLVDLAGKERVNLEEAVRIKLKFNAQRPHRHGGKKV